MSETQGQNLAVTVLYVRSWGEELRGEERTTRPPTHGAPNDAAAVAAYINYKTTAYINYKIAAYINYKTFFSAKGQRTSVLKNVPGANRSNKARGPASEDHPADPRRAERCRCGVRST